MPPDLNIPDDLNKLDPSEEKMRSTTGKEWLLVYAAIFVLS